MHILIAKMKVNQETKKAAANYISTFSIRFVRLNNVRSFIFLVCVCGRGVYTHADWLRLHGPQAIPARTPPLPQEGGIPTLTLGTGSGSALTALQTT